LSIRDVASAADRLLARVDRRLASPWVWGVAVALVLALQVGAIVAHVPWRDEWQSLMIAVQTRDAAALFENLRFEGHPPLWYWLLRGLAYVADPVHVLALAAGILALTTLAVILFASPFLRVERLMLSTSAFILFEFNTISRSLTLGVCLIMLAMALWRSRGVWLVLCLLPLTDFLFGVISIILLALLWREKRLNVIGVGMWVAASLFAAWTVIPDPRMVTPISLLAPPFELVTWLSRLGVLLLPLQWAGRPVWDSIQPFPFSAVMWLGFLLFSWAMTRGMLWGRRLLFGFILLTAVFSCFVYALPTRHLMLIVVVLIVLKWLEAADGKTLTSGFRLWLAGASACGLHVAALSFVQPFDAAPEVAAVIEQRGLADKHWMSFPAPNGVSVTGLTGIKFERPQGHCMQPFTRWNYRPEFATMVEFERFLLDEVRRHGRFYLLSGVDLALARGDVVRQLSKIESGYNSEPYWLYEVGPGQPERTVSLPDCVPNLRPLERLRL
jgi:hypothetical protein